MMAPPVALFNWTGFYVGGNFGVGLSRNIFTGDELVAPTMLLPASNH